MNCCGGLVRGAGNRPPGQRRSAPDVVLFGSWADVAQLVEQSIRNRQVIGSSPIVGSSFSSHFQGGLLPIGPPNCPRTVRVQATHGRYEVVYVGMTGGPEAGMRSRLRRHHQRLGKRAWTHFSLFDVWENIPEVLAEATRGFQTGWLSDGISSCARARLTRWVGRKRTGLRLRPIEMPHVRRSTMNTTNARLGSRNSTREDRLARTRQRHGFEHDATGGFRSRRSRRAVKADGTSTPATIACR